MLQECRRVDTDLVLLTKGRVPDDPNSRQAVIVNAIRNKVLTERMSWVSSADP